jgi:hypothetical protein
MRARGDMGIVLVALKWVARLKMAVASRWLALGVNTGIVDRKKQPG